MKTVLDPKEKQILQVISSNAAVDASKTLSKWCRSDIRVTIDKVELIPFQEVVARTGSPDSVSVGLYTHIEKGVTGSLLLIMSEPSADSLLNLLIKKRVNSERKPNQELTEIEKSALMETANILSCAYLNSLRMGLQVEMIPGPPVLMHDLTQSIMDSILMEQAAYQDESLFFDVAFAHHEIKLNWHFFYLPLFAPLQQILKSTLDNASLNP